jgi:hypothetical protein
MEKNEIELLKLSIRFDRNRIELSIIETSLIAIGIGLCAFGVANKRRALEKFIILLYRY